LDNCYQLLLLLIGGPNTAYGGSFGGYGVHSALVINGGNIYQCLATGTSASSGGPTTMSTSGIIDNTTAWGYVGVAAWAPTTTYQPWGNGTAGIQFVTNGGNIYICLASTGTSAGSGGPTGTNSCGIIDNDVTWGYFGGALAAGFTVQSTDVADTDAVFCEIIPF
jgi:hypothetical protein